MLPGGQDLHVFRRQQAAPLDRPECSLAHSSVDRRFRVRVRSSGRVKDSTAGCVGIRPETIHKTCPIDVASGAILGTSLPR
jgi:hypothetical protein